MKNFDYSDINTYRQLKFDSSKERRPIERENAYIKGQKAVISYDKNATIESTVAFAYNGGINQAEKHIVSILAVLGGVASPYCVKNMLYMMGVPMGSEPFNRSRDKLHRAGLVYFINYEKEQPRTAVMQSVPAQRVPGAGSKPVQKAELKCDVMALTYAGYFFAEYLGVKCDISNPFKMLDRHILKVKIFAQAAMLVTNYIKNMPVEKFAIRPDINYDEGRKSISPNAYMRIGGTDFYVLVIRNQDTWKDYLVNKLNEYSDFMVQESNAENVPVLIINGESVDMNFEVNELLRENNINLNVAFTDDLAMFGNGFKYSLYDFDDEGNVILYSLIDDEENASDNQTTAQNEESVLSETIEESEPVNEENNEKASEPEKLEEKEPEKDVEEKPVKPVKKQGVAKKKTAAEKADAKDEAENKSAQNKSAKSNKASKKEKVEDSAVESVEKEVKAEEKEAKVKEKKAETAKKTSSKQPEEKKKATKAVKAKKDKENSSENAEIERNVMTEEEAKAVSEEVKKSVAMKMIAKQKAEAEMREVEKNKATQIEEKVNETEASMVNSVEQPQLSNEEVEEMKQRFKAKLLKN